MVKVRRTWLVPEHYDTSGWPQVDHDLFFVGPDGQQHVVEGVGVKVWLDEAGEPEYLYYEIPWPSSGGHALRLTEIYEDTPTLLRAEEQRLGQITLRRPEPATQSF